MRGKLLTKLALSAIFAVSLCQGVTAQEGWQITTHERSENYAGVTLSNGRIGIVSSDYLFSTREIVLAGVYDKETASGVSRVMEGLNMLNLLMFIDQDMVDNGDVSNLSQTLDMRKATFTTAFDYKEKAHIEYDILALRNLPYAGMMVVRITPKSDIEIDVRNVVNWNKQRFSDPVVRSFTLQDTEIKMPLFQATAKSRYSSKSVASTSTFMFDHKQPHFITYEHPGSRHMWGFEREIKAGETYEFALVTSFCTEGDFSDAKSESERFAVYAQRNDMDILRSQHYAHWERLWENDIIIEGDDQAQLDVRLALYHLFAFAAEGTRLSIAPMGLSTSSSYNGHIFWDAELWMYPPILLFEQGIAKSMVDYRFDRLEQARKKATNHGYDGAMFPWESDDTGEEATPTWALTGTFEHHITADVGIAAWNYYLVTGDKQWLKDVGYPIIRDVADFWVSRASRNEDGSYSIINVVGANEFAHNVDDNAFTNGSAIVCLNNATKAAKALKETSNLRWAELAAKIKIHYSEQGHILEHSKYAGEEIKQADVNLLTYPLGLVKDKETIVKNLKYYEPKLYADGPAMSQSVFSVIYSRLGDSDEAYRLFQRSYLPNKRPPFGVLSESPYSSNPYFATGAGGLLQAVLFGFAALQITEDGVVRGEPSLPKHWKSITLKGVGVDNETWVIK